MGSDTTRKNVLLVDDEPAVLTSIGLMLETAGYQAQTASSGAEALAALKKTPFDLLIVDNHMPGMSGLELANTAKSHWPTLPILMFTGYPPSEPVECLDLILTKPSGMSRLLATVGQLLSADRASR
jgi:CheY-like chemotaxis protein